MINSEFKTLDYFTKDGLTYSLIKIKNENVLEYAIAKERYGEKTYLDIEYIKTISVNTPNEEQLEIEDKLIIMMMLLNID